MTDAGGHLTVAAETTGKPKPDSVSVATTKLFLASGAELEVEAPFDKVVKELENAVRSSAGTLARLTEAGTGEPVALNAAHVVAVRPGNR